MFDKILTVCVGNICRSPSAEIILQNKLPNKTVSSAGLGALEEHGVEEHAAKILTTNGFNANNHKARQINGDMVNDAELILVMEKRHQQSLMKKYPSASGKVMLLGKWHNDEEIPDPYKKSTEVFEYAYQLIAKNCDAWAQRLK